MSATGHNAHIASLGFRLESTQDEALIAPLLRACGLKPLGDQEAQSEYLMVSTPAGGIAACVGWSKVAGAAAVHSLAVAPPSRGSGLGASLLASAMAMVMDAHPVEAIYARAGGGAARFFALFGFITVDEREAERMAPELREHVSLASQSDLLSQEDKAPDHVMVRHYRITPRGLDQCAFRLLRNEESAGGVLPPGAVLFFRQTGQMIEATYRGGAVRRGHILGHIEQDEIAYRWHAYTGRDRVVFGSGALRITSLEDGRRQLGELHDGSDEGAIGLSLREV